MSENQYLLEMLDIDKQFPGVKALDHARLQLRQGTVHALMGENGAGKSTLMKCLFGIYTRDGGTVTLDGKPDQTVLLPVDNHNRKQEMYNNYDLVDGSHTLDFKWLNPVPGVDVTINYLLTYKARPTEIDTF